METKTWRSLGWLFANGWSVEEVRALRMSGLVESRTIGRRVELLVDETDDLADLRGAAKFVNESKLKKLYQDAAEKVVRPGMIYSKSNWKW
jgi:hypothetical protein